MEKSLTSIQCHVIEGPHPTGNPGFQIHHIDPINRGEFVWVVRPQDLVLIIQFLTTGMYPQRIRLAVTGEVAPNPHYIEIPWGVPVSSVMGSTATDPEIRAIAGNILPRKMKKRGIWVL